MTRDYAAAKTGGITFTVTPGDGDEVDSIEVGAAVLDGIERTTSWRPGRYKAEITVVDLGEKRLVTIRIS